MEEGIVQNLLRSLHRWIFWPSLAMLVGAVVGWPIRQSSYEDIITGPHPLDRDLVQALTTDGELPHRYVVVDITNAQRTDMESYEGASNVKTFMALPVSDQSVLLIMERKRYLVGPLDFSKEREGLLTMMPPHMARFANRPLVLPVDPNDADGPSRRYRILPIILDCDATALAEPVIWLLVLGCLAAAGTGGLALLLLWRLAPRWHPIIRHLRRFGEPMEVAAAIDADLAGDQNPLDRGNPARLGAEWLVYPSFFGFQAVRLDDMVWVYLTEIDRRLYGSLYRITVKSSDGWDHTVPIFRRDDAEGTAGLLTWITGSRPWVYVGETEEYAAWWRNDREGMVAAVHRRRELC